MLLMRLLSRLPLGLLYALGRVLAFLIADLLGYRKKVVERNMRRSFPDWDEATLKKNARRFYDWLSDVLMESLKALTMPPTEIQKRVRFTNPELVESLKGKPLIAAAAHIGNWEWVLLKGSLDMGMEMDAAYMPVSNAFFEKLMRTIRTRFGATAIPGNKLVREELKRRHINRVICMVSDQRPMPESAYWLHFLNQDTAAFRGLDTLAKFFQYPVYYLDVRRVKRGYYELEVKEIGAPPYDKHDMRILDNYYSCLEETLQADPAAWLWTHKRWKDPKPATQDADEKTLGK